MNIKDLNKSVAHTRIGIVKKSNNTTLTPLTFHRLQSSFTTTSPSTSPLLQHISPTQKQQRSPQPQPRLSVPFQPAAITQSVEDQVDNSQARHQVHHQVRLQQVASPSNSTWMPSKASPLFNGTENSPTTVQQRVQLQFIFVVMNFTTPMEMYCTLTSPTSHRMPNRSFTLLSTRLKSHLTAQLTFSVFSMD